MIRRCNDTGRLVVAFFYYSGDYLKNVMLRLDRSIKFLMDSLYEPWLVKPGNDSF